MGYSAFDELTATYRLTIFRTVTLGELTTSMPVENLVIRSPEHKADGSICFLGADRKLPDGCIKTDSYILKRQ